MRFQGRAPAEVQDSEGQVLEILMLDNLFIPIPHVHLTSFAVKPQYIPLHIKTTEMYIIQVESDDVTAVFSSLGG